MKTPVALLIFNRPETTFKVFNVIRKIKPQKLFVVADGPRTHISDDSERCISTRKIIDSIDWNCQVFKRYSDTNLGCRNCISSGLDWVFGLVDEAIILEDDCLPDVTFFRYCEELLDKYRDDERVMSITGSNLLNEWKTNLQDYHFSYYFNCWGWATWKRAWQYYDVNMKLWSNSEVQCRVRDVIYDKKMFINRKRELDATSFGKNNSWAFQFFFACLAYSGYTITPSKNLVSNIGFIQEATHTFDSYDPRANLYLQSMTFPLREPVCFAVDRQYDYLRYKKIWKKSPSSKIVNKFKRLLSSFKVNVE